MRGMSGDKEELCKAKIGLGLLGLEAYELPARLKRRSMVAQITLAIGNTEDSLGIAWIRAKNISIYLCRWKLWR